MKKMKKAAAMLMAATVAVAMPMTAMAASITVENAIAGAEYKAYRVFDYTKTADGEGYAYTISKDSPWLNFIQGRSDDFDLTPSTDGEVYVVKALDDIDAEKLATEMKKEVAKNAEITCEKTEVANENGATLDIGELGYYFVDTTSGTFCSLISSSDTVRVSEKNVKPAITKKITLEKNGSDANYTQYIGSDVTYRINVTKGRGITDAITVHDEMDEELELKPETIVVKNGTTELTKDIDYTVSTREIDCTFEVTLNSNYVEDLEDGADVTIEYSATVKDSARSAVAMKNSAKVQYKNYMSEAAEVSVYEYQFDLKKVIKGTETLLNGAEFELRENDKDGKALSFVSDGEGYHVVADGEADSTTTIVAGEVTIRGLKDGKYSLVEIKAPDGYNVLDVPTEVVISDANAEAVVVENSTGTILPSTGGIGTTVFYAAGIVVMAGAVFFVVRSRKHE